MKKLILLTSVVACLALFLWACTDDNAQKLPDTPSIHNISPARGPAGSKITISGENFSAVENNTVRIGDRIARIISASDTELVVTVPQGTGIGNLEVILNGNSDIKGSFTMTGKPEDGGGGDGDGDGDVILNTFELLLYPFPHYAEQLEVLYANSQGEDPIIWASEDESVATVDENGLVTPISVGFTYITATVGSDIGYCAVTVADGPVTKLLLDESKLDLFTDQQAQLNIATLKADVQQPGDPVWSTSNEDVAIVDQQGNVTALDQGTATITVTVDNASDSCDVYVSPNVYVAGYQRIANVDVATLWKNGVPIALSNGNDHAQAFSVWVDGTDVYVAGFELINGVIKARLWINGIGSTLQSGSVATSVRKLGEDLYVGGRDQAIAKVWINGNGMDFSDGSKTSNIWSLFVDGQDIYAAGVTVDNFTFNPIASFWENEMQTDFTDGSDNAYGKSVYKNSNDIYVAGSEVINGVNTARLWTNGVPVSLTHPNTGGAAEAVLVSNNNVYVAGYERLNGEFRATVWTNGVPDHYQEIGDVPTWGYSIFVKGTDIYVAGHARENGVLMPMLWKNGNIVNLNHVNTDAAVFGTSAVFVK